MTLSILVTCNNAEQKRGDLLLRAYVTFWKAMLPRMCVNFNGQGVAVMRDRAVVIRLEPNIWCCQLSSYRFTVHPNSNELPKLENGILFYKVCWESEHTAQLADLLAMAKVQQPGS